MYYSELDEAGAPTATAKAHPGELTSYDEETAPHIGVGGALPEGKESIRERLYAEERPVRYRPGTAIL